jgi:hypothetical protein
VTDSAEDVSPPDEPEPPATAPAIQADPALVQTVVRHSPAEPDLENR